MLQNMKIDINEIRAYCEAQLEPRAACGDIVNLARQDAFSDILDRLDMIEQGIGDIEDEPQGLDEAAAEYAKSVLSNKYAILRVDIADAFKAGAKWQLAKLKETCDIVDREYLKAAMEAEYERGKKEMAEQGVTVEGKFHRSCGYPSVIELNTYLQQYDGDKVIVQIRKAD